jgi:hypothetical protein
VDIIRTDVSEDRIASIFSVHECEMVTERSEPAVSYEPVPIQELTVSYEPVPIQELTASYEPVPIQELTTSLCNQLSLVHPEDGGDTILRNVGSYKSHTVSFPRR